MTRHTYFFSNDTEEYMLIEDRLKHDDKLSADIDQIRNTNSIDIDKLEVAHWEALNEGFYLQNPKLTEGITVLMSNHSLPKKYKDTVFQFVLDKHRGFVKKQYNTKGVKVIVDYSKLDSITIEVGNQSYFSDIREAFDAILELQGRRGEKHSTKSKLRRDLRVYELYRLGKTVVEIAITTENEFTEELTFSSIRGIVTKGNDRNNIAEKNRMVLYEDSIKNK